MPYSAFLARIRRLIRAPNPHLNVIADPSAQGDTKQPAQPMSDQELASAIREFYSIQATSPTQRAARLTEPKLER